MAKKKLSFGEGGFKGFLARHVEKILFGIVGLVSVLIIWSGFSGRRGIEADKTPAALNQEVTRATSHLDSFNWETHFRDTRSPKDQADLTARAAETLQKMSEESYAMGQMLAPPVSTPRTKRTDPALLVAIDLQARPGYGALVKSTQIRDAGRNADDASPLDSVQEQELPDFDPKVYRKIPQGMGRTGRGGRGGEMGGGYGMARSSEAGKGVYFVAVTGLIPFRQQLEVYQSSFLNASSFSPGRDVPTYVSWVLERSPVAAGSDKRQWKKRITLKTAEKFERDFGSGRRAGGEFGGGDQYIDPMCQDGKLTRPGPPLIARDLDRLYRHSRVLPFDEAVRQRRLEAAAVVEEEAVDGEDAGAEDDLGIEIDPRMMAGRGGEEFGPRMDGRPMGELSEYRGEQMGGFEGEGGPMGFGERQMRGGAGQVLGNVDPSEAPEFKMFRYVDLEVEAGRTYVYRLRLVLEDPNYPASVAAEPPEAALEGSVIQRRKQLKSDLAARKMKRKRWYRQTDPSEESNLVTIMEGQRILAGEVEPARLTVPKGGFAYLRTGEEPTGQAMALRFDVDRAADIPGVISVRRGTVANFTAKETEALIPAYGMLEKMEDVPFRLNSMVLDLRGGDKLKFDELKAPGEMLVLNARGRLVVLDEVKDAEDYEANIFPEEEMTRPGRGGEFRPPEGGFGDEGRPNFNPRGGAGRR